MNNSKRYYFIFPKPEYKDTYYRIHSVDYEQAKLFNFKTHALLELSHDVYPASFYSWFGANKMVEYLNTKNVSINS